MGESSPPMRIVFYRNSRGRLPALDWLSELADRDAALFVHVVATLEELAARGRALGPPACVHVAAGIHELRARAPRPCPPILFFFHGESAVALGPLTRPGDPLPLLSLVRACQHRRAFERDPIGRSHAEYAESEAL